MNYILQKVSNCSFTQSSESAALNVPKENIPIATYTECAFGLLSCEGLSRL